MSKYPFFALLLIPLLFLIIGLTTLTDYGVNWDNAMHYNRGHAYLHYFLTGKENFLDLHKNPKLDEAVDFKDIRGNYMQLYKDVKKNKQINKDSGRSHYQSDVFNFEYFKEKDSGHPPLNGILAALSNYIFYQKLGILSDLYSHQLFGIFTAAILILGVVIFARTLFGILPAIIAGSALALYPLFLGESHFNIKDPVLTSFFGLTIILFYHGVVRRNITALIGSAIFAGLSLGTKFNTLFLPFILGPWLFFYWATVKKLKVTKKELAALLIYTSIPPLILYVSWPYLWFHGLQGLLSIVNYYRVEGIGSAHLLTPYTYLGFNFFPIFWITITTPIPILILSFIGVIGLVLKVVQKKSHSSLLILLWLVVPITRVTLPNTVIYGGVRHIMEFIPALALTTGAGSYFLLKHFKQIRPTVIILLIFCLSLIVMEMIQIHPNQNIYFNQFIGGLPGAKNKNVPFWGNSFGNAYQQGVIWLNINAEKNAKLGLPIGGTVNLPRENLRADINLSNDHFSAFERKGEYEIEMSHDGLPKSMFTYSYLENFLNPIYEVKVEGVPILKIWKNDPAHTKNGFEKEAIYKVAKVTTTENRLDIGLAETVYLTRLYLNYGKSDCININSGRILTSLGGTNWTTESDPISYPQMSAKQINAEKTDFFFLFAAKPAKFIKVESIPNSCLLGDPKIEVRGLEKTPN